MLSILKGTTLLQNLIFLRVFFLSGKFVQDNPHYYLKALYLSVAVQAFTFLEPYEQVLFNRPLAHELLCIITKILK